MLDDDYDDDGCDDVKYKKYRRSNSDLKQKFLKMIYLRLQ